MSRNTYSQTSHLVHFNILRHMHPLSISSLSPPSPFSLCYKFRLGMNSYNQLICHSSFLAWAEVRVNSYTTAWASYRYPLSLSLNPLNISIYNVSAYVHSSVLFFIDPFAHCPRCHGGYCDFVNRDQCYMCKFDLHDNQLPHLHCLRQGVSKQISLSLILKAIFYSKGMGLESSHNLF